MGAGGADIGRAATPYVALIGRYADAVNRGDWNACADLFAADAAITIDLGERGVRRLVGGTALADFVSAAVARFSTFEMAVLDATQLDGAPGDTSRTDGVPSAVDGRGVMVLMESRVDAATSERSRAVGRYIDRFSLSTAGDAQFTARSYKSLLLL